MTVAERIIEEMKEKGYEFISATSGWFSFRKGSNLRNKLDGLGLTQQDVEVRCGAKKQHRSQGTDLLIFRRK